MHVYSSVYNMCLMGERERERDREIEKVGELSRPTKEYSHGGEGEMLELYF